MATQADPLAEELLNRYQDLKAERDAVFMDDWQTISQYCLPQDSDINVKKTEGVAGWTEDIYDTTGIEAAQTLKMGQYTWLTPPNQPWAQYDPPDELKDGENSEDEATAWLGRASDITLKELARSNFYPMASMCYLGVGVFGTDLLIVEEGKKNALNFRHAKIGTYVIEEDDEGVVDTTMREFELTYRQAKQMFNKPEDSLPAKMADSAKGPTGLRKKFKFLHCIFPREDSQRLPNRKDGAHKPIASVYISIEFRESVRVSGYDEQPALCSRFDKWGTGSPWGYGPAFLTLPIMRQLNYVQQYLDALAELHAYPRVLVPDNLEGDVDLRAGGYTVINSAEGSARPEEWATVGEYKLGLEMQEQRRKQLRDAWMTDAFKLLNSMPLLDKKMTAFEISQRQAENLSSFTPSLGRRVVEFLNPLMLRVFGILYRAGKFGAPPDSLMVDAGHGKRGLVLPSVLITNRLTDALKALKNRATEETFQFLVPLMETKPEVLDLFDMDKVVRNYALNSGMAADDMRPQKGANSVAAIRQQRAQMMQQQRTAELAEKMGGTVKDLGAAPEPLQKAVLSQFTGKAA
jgi:hypothetical protein